jgi:hypothetical protein
MSNNFVLKSQMMPSFLEKAFPDNLHLQPKNLKELCEASIL